MGGAASSERTLMPLLYLSTFSAGSSVSYLGLYASYKVGFTAHPASPFPKENHKESIKVTFLTIVQGDDLRDVRMYQFNFSDLSEMFSNKRGAFL